MKEKQYIGIIAAMNEEMCAIQNKMKNIEEKTIFDLKCYIGMLGKQECILVKCGVGKVNAARTAQILIDQYSIKEIINVGSAGALKEELNIGDIVIGEELIQYDFDVTVFGHPKGYISDTGKGFLSDCNLIKRAKEVMSNSEYFVKVGIIATGDTFFNEREKGIKIVEDFNADCVEMEGAAIAQVCYLDQIPFLVIRSISDTPNGKNSIDFSEYLEIASKRCADFLLEFYS